MHIQNLTAFLLEIAHEAGIVAAISPEQMVTAKGISIRYSLARARVEMYGIGEGNREFKKLVKAASENPTGENFAALERAGSREHMEAAYDQLRSTAKLAVSLVWKNEAYPFLLPIMTEHLAALEEAVARWTEKDVAARSRFPSLGLTSPSPLVEAMNAAVASFKREIGNVGGGDRGLFDEALAEMGIDLASVDAPANRQVPLETARDAAEGPAATTTDGDAAWKVMQDEILAMTAANGGHDPGVFPPDA